MLAQDVMVMDQPSDHMNVYKGGEAPLQGEAVHSLHHMDHKLGESPTHLHACNDIQR